MRSTWTLLAITWLSLCGCGRTSANYADGKLFVSGRIDGDSVDISPKRPGIIIEITVREGASVKAGQVLAVISSPQDEARYEAQKARVLSDQHKVQELQRELATYGEKIRQAQMYREQAETNAPAEVKQAEANLATAKAELARSEAELEQSKIEAERYPPLAAMGAVSKQLAEQYTTKLDIARATTDAKHKEVAAAEASLQAAKAQLYNPPIKEADRLTLERQVEALKQRIASAQADVETSRKELLRNKADLDDLNIRSPIDGTILTRSAEPGRVVASGQTILTMVDLNRLYLRGFVPGGNVGKVKVGQSAEVYLDSNPKQAVPAQVIRIDPQVMFTPENTYFQSDRVKQVMGVKLGLLGAYGYAKPGMPADGQIQIGSQ